MGQFEKIRVEQIEHEASREDRAEIFWRKIEEEARDFYSAGIDEKYAGRSYDRGEVDEKKNDAVLRERSFVSSLIREVEKEREGGGEKELLVLLDIDDTIGQPDFDRETGKLNGTILRPSIVKLLRYIQGEFSNIKFGFLTTRGGSFVREQLEDEKYLKRLQEYIDPGAIYSTAEYEQSLLQELGDALESDDRDKAQKIQEKINALKNSPRNKELKNYLRRHPEIQENKIPPDESFRWVPGDYKKLEALKSIREKNPNASILAVDDLQYPAFMKRGVCVYPDAMFYY